ncbi:Vault protein inter-alpha-trypsin [Symmachiella macrocystis]|uniref:Vault protein inter-alpha-trypsin n=1 Tax=Symmachiella macrocystis TaxID=2527985 RepID=A0A5C6BJL2_9PLAN|nr:VIT domain-containing protein [Symmachiella macrocystis]TWU12210.1 Vault protein inter-alpha-trypsin [Symmachiella macrocystis]
MTNESFSDQPDHDEERMMEMFRSLDSSALPPNRVFLEELRQRSTEEFVRNDARSSAVAPVANPPSTAPVVWNGRWVVVAVAALVVCVGFFFSPLSQEQPALAFGEVLAKVAAADTLHLQLTRNGKTDEVWIRQPGQMRWQEDPARYRIVQGSRLWRIDEEENVVADEDSPYFDGVDSHFDILQLLQVDQTDAIAAKFQRRPSGQTRRDGKDCYVYQLQFAGEDGVTNEDISIEALVEMKTNELRWLETKVRRDGRFVPAGEIRVLALNRPIDDEKFVVGAQLTEDGRIGKVSDVQGLVTIKPVMNRRWTPVGGPMLIKPGDWLRTDIRGPNAAEVKLEGGGTITLGPGSLIELIKPGDVRLLQGEAQIAAAEKPVTLRGPGEQVIPVAETQFFRIDDEKLAMVADKPLWLTGFEGTTTNEVMGSLIANVDDRNVSLTIGAHHVKVEIRDQIARTTIEESFVNHTGSRLEGVFHFPLPANASISGFGMWIGDELVEADIVEKQRAREIYETILREKRDPGLLEWTGGNIFKARVFPILPYSEKRIKITYTQVLPLRGHQYRYSYGLQSEMLKQTPLRELSIDLKVHSAMPLAQVTCPTHPTRIEVAGNSGHVEFTAQDYRPTRDFEAVIEVADHQADVVMIPHRRGEDGYFLMQLMPPAGEGRWQRDVLPNGDPLDLLLITDTSGSMNRSQRAKQTEFVATLLASLSPQDRFNLICSDVQSHAVFKEPVAATEDNVAVVLQFLDGRVSLGWTDLDAAFSQAMPRVQSQTHVVYVGDGIVNTTDADPIAFANRLKRMYADQGTFHAVATGNSYESSVLQAIASLGGGSWRAVSGEKGPRVIATELLQEISQPALRDIQVEFQGLQVAAVYPEQLPNVPAGRQQVILGRYLPEGRDQVGDVIVTGKLNGETVRYRSRVTLADAESGNSFIPRLWARSHLDHLLAQGTSQSIQDEIIALSEEFHIMTPYTSLLVLESDADRERFKVERRFQMRDGERFFAKGLEDANYELKQKQMLAAKEWQTQMRAAVLQELSAMGRTIPVTSQSAAVSTPRSGGMAGVGGSLRGNGKYDSYFGRGKDSPDFGIVGKKNWNLGFSDGNGIFTDRLSVLGDLPQQGETWDYKERDSSTFSYEYADGDFSSSFDGGLGLPSASWTNPRMLDLEVGLDAIDEVEQFYLWDGPALGEKIGRRSRRSSRMEESNSPFFGGTRLSYQFESKFASGPSLSNRAYAGVELVSSSGTHVLRPVVPQVPGVPQPRKPQPPPENWPAAAVELADSLLRTEQLAGLKSGLEITRTSEYFEPRWKTTTTRSERLELVSPTAWLMRNEQIGSQTFIHWCDEKQRGILSEAFLLGQVRDSEPEDLKQPPLDFSDYSVHSIAGRYSSYTATMLPAGENRATLVLQYPDDDDRTVTFLIDTMRHVLLKVINANDGESSETTYSDFVEVGGRWWVQQIEYTNTAGERTRLIRQTVTALEPEAFDKRKQSALALREQALLFPQPLPTVHAARRAIASGDAQFEHYVTMLLYHAVTQQWDRVWEVMPSLEQAAAGKPGIRWVRDQVFRISRRNHELQRRLLEEAAAIAKQPVADDLFLAEFLAGQTSGILQANEQMELHDSLKPVFDRQVDSVQGPKRWLQRRANLLNSSGRARAALEVYQLLATTYPHDMHLQTQYAHMLANRNQYTAAYEWLDNVLQSQPLWNDQERSSLRETYAGLLRVQSRYPDLVAYLAQWTAENPTHHNVYGQYLNALIWNGQLEQAEQLMTDGFALVKQAEPLSDAQMAQLTAAVRLAIGRGYRLRTDRLLDKWEQPLADVVRQSFQIAQLRTLANEIMGSSVFSRSEASREIRTELAEQILGMLESFKPRQIHIYTEWLSANNPEIKQATWNSIAETLQKRWDAVDHENLRRPLGDVLQWIYSQHFDVRTQLEFLRARLARSSDRHHDQQVSALFNLLLGQPWSPEFEDELWSLVPNTAEHWGAPQRLSLQVDRLRQLIDRLTGSRFDAEWQKVEHPEKLKRDEYRDKRKQAMRQARTAVADRLAVEMDKQQSPLRDWYQAELVYANIELDRDLEQAVTQCWKLLGETPPVETAETRLAGTATLRERALVTLMNLAARKTATAAEIARLLAYIDAGIAAGGESVERWRHQKYLMLVALDRADDLSAALRLWISQSEFTNQWRVVLARLLAERGELEAAVKLFETVEHDKELSPADYRVLAEWYMALDRRDDYEGALLQVYAASGEHELQNWLWNQRRQQNNNQLTTELDPQVLYALRSLLARATHPQNHLSLVREFYQLNHDFRLLESLAGAVVGQTPERVYPFLQGMSSVLAEIRDEATADELLANIVAVRKQAKSATDRRALDLLEVLVERRAAELQNQPGPHAAAAIAALKRAFNRPWETGEQRLMAEFLNSLGKISQTDLAQEQVRELHELFELATPGTEARLYIGHRLAISSARYGKLDTAVRWLQVVLNEYELGNKGFVLQDIQGPIYSCLEYLERQQHFAAAEELVVHWNKLLGDQALQVRLNAVYLSALQQGGNVSLGSGAELYRNLQQRLKQQLSVAADARRYELVSLLCGVYRAAHDQQIAASQEDLQGFAAGVIPNLLKHQQSQYEGIIRRVNETLDAVVGPAKALEFLVSSMEAEPARYRYSRNDSWNHFAGRINDLRKRIANLGALKLPLLSLVTRELRRDLLSQQPRNQAIYHSGYSEFWQQQTAAFAAVAEEVLAAHRDSPAVITYVANYLYNGLQQFDRAIQIYFQANDRGLLDEGGKYALVIALQGRQRYGESIPVLRDLVERAAGNLEYRARLMEAYHYAQRPEDLVAFIDETDEYFHADDRWNEAAIATLARGCLVGDLNERAIGYFNEAIALHQRTRPNRGVGDGVLSDYYQEVSTAHVELGQTDKAVEAACGAIVSWGRRQNQRQQAIDSLVDVLRGIPDRDAYVARLDAETEKTGQDRPMVRRALGQAYLQLGQPQAAATQLELAIELQPADMQAQKLLLECYEKLKEQPKIIAQLLRMTELQPREIDLYRRLGAQLSDDAAQQERAYTSIVEATPNESEGHVMLAEIRQSQNNWEAASKHWEAVAEIRKLEPTGLLGLAKAQIHQRQWPAAEKTLDKLRNTKWPKRFDKMNAQTRELQRQVDQHIE